MRATGELLEAYKKGDIEAMEQIVDMYKDDVYNLCCRLSFNRTDADELFQETWLNVLRYSDKYNDRSFRNWLYTICINRYRDRCRKEAGRTKHLSDNYRSSVEKDHAFSLLKSDEDIEEKVETKYVNRLLVRKIDSLDDKFRIPVKLFYFEDMCYADIAEVCHIPEGTVKSRINAAKEKLRKMMESELI
ncbi:MAG TPA: sigma-70 family RNA polymerase sigma factor [Clostridia bacterium]|jgi:RNA polymerase sigma-70 factor (ECF subfamily)|nr:sigma-70 family RNA polymerase sigma factor [Clostridia bacterium]